MKSARIGFALAAMLITAQVGIAGDETPRDQKLARQAVVDSPLVPMSLGAIFAAAAVDQSVSAPIRGMRIGEPSLEVLVARVENGKVVTACVSSEAAARRFLEAQRDGMSPV